MKTKFMAAFAIAALGLVCVAGCRSNSSAATDSTSSSTAMGSSAGSTRSSSTSIGTECGILSKQDVSSAIGIPVVDTRQDEHGCHYLAHGTVNSLGNKHTAMAMKADPRMMAAMLAGQPDAAGDAASPELTSVIDVDVQPRLGLGQFNLESTTLAGRKPGAPAQAGLEGIGDNAFAIGNNAIIAHKGDKFITITLSNCPCTLQQVAPLGVKLTAGL